MSNHVQEQMRVKRVVRINHRKTAILYSKRVYMRERVKFSQNYVHVDCICRQNKEFFFCYDTDFLECHCSVEYQATFFVFDTRTRPRLSLFASHFFQSFLLEVTMTPKIPKDHPGWCYHTGLPKTKWAFSNQIFARYENIYWKRKNLSPFWGPRILKSSGHSGTYQIK